MGLIRTSRKKLERINIMIKLDLNMAGKPRSTFGSMRYCAKPCSPKRSCHHKTMIYALCTLLFVSHPWENRIGCYLISSFQGFGEAKSFKPTHLTIRKQSKGLYALPSGDNISGLAFEYCEKKGDFGRCYIDTAASQVGDYSVSSQGHEYHFFGEPACEATLASCGSLIQWIEFSDDQASLKLTLNHHYLDPFLGQSYERSSKMRIKRINCNEAQP